jgi:O-antigen ligase
LNKTKKPVISQVTNKLEKTLFEKFYFLFFLLLPIIYSDSIIDSVLVPRQIFLTIFTFIIGILICYQISINKLKGDFSFLKTPFFIGFSGLIISILISFYQSIVVSESYYFLSKISVEILFLILTTFLIIQGQLSSKSLIQSVVWFTIITLLIAAYQILNLYQTDEYILDHINEITSSNGNKNLLASILFLTLPFILYSFGNGKIWRYVSIIIVLSSVFLFWLLQTKTVIIAFLIFLVLAIGFVIKRKAQGVRKSILIILIISFILVIVGLFYISITYKDFFPHLFSLNTFNTRVLLWKNSIEMIKENTVFGVGAGNWQINFPKYGLDKFAIGDVTNGITTYQRPHNDFLWVFCEMGIFGIISYIFIFISILYYGIRLIKIKKESQNYWFYILLLSAIIGYVLISLADFPLERIEHQIILYTIFSILFGNYYSSKNNNVNNEPIKLSFLLISFLLLFITLMIVITNRYKGEFHSRQINIAHQTNNWNTLIEEVDLAQNTFYSIDPMSIPVFWYKGVALFSSENINDAKIEFEKSFKLNPYNIHVLNNLASCNEKLGNHNDAELYYKKALNISPQFKETLLNLSAVYYNTKKFEQAFQTIDKCNVASSDPKYKLFLTSILISKIDLIIQNTTDKNKLQKLVLLKTDTNRLEKIYFDSKYYIEKFEPYVLKSLI